MTPRIPKDKSRLMLVEGKDDKEFFIQLAINLGVIDNWQLHIEKYGGKNKLGNFLRGLMKHPNFDQIHKNWGRSGCRLQRRRISECAEPY